MRLYARTLLALIVLLSSATLVAEDGMSASVFSPQLESAGLFRPEQKPSSYLDSLANTSQGTLFVWAPQMLGVPTGPNNGWLKRIFIVWHSGSWQVQSYGSMPFARLKGLLGSSCDGARTTQGKGRVASMSSSCSDAPDARYTEQLFALAPPPAFGGRVPVAPVSGTVAEMTYMTAAPNPFVALSVKLRARGPRSFVFDLSAHGVPQALRPLALRLRTLIRRGQSFSLYEGIPEFELMAGGENLRLSVELHGREQLFTFIDKLFQTVQP